MAEVSRKPVAPDPLLIEAHGTVEQQAAKYRRLLHMNPLDRDAAICAALDREERIERRHPK